MATKTRKHARLRGILAEWLAALVLCCKGYRLLGWRIRTPVGEIDLLMNDRRQLINVEVKYRSRLEDGLEVLSRVDTQRQLRALLWVQASRPRDGHLQPALHRIAIDRFGRLRHIQMEGTDFF
ncbi:MAG: YraN family protein [Pseudomonadota bacterium]